MKRRLFKPGVTCWNRKHGWKGKVIEVRGKGLCRIVIVDWIGMIGYYTPDELRLS